VRHGETEANSKEINEGHREGELTEKGRQQAKKVALRLKEEKLDVIYVSDLKRAVDTAAEIIKHHPNVEVIYEPSLREQSHGIYEGSPYGTISKVAKEAGLAKMEFRPEGGESINDAKKRVKKFLDRIFNEDKDKTVLVVTHGGVIVNILIQLFNYPDEDYKTILPSNTAVSIIELDFKDRHKLITLNCIKHLL